MTRVTALSVLFGFALAGNVYGQQVLGTCAVLPANNIWNTPVDTLPVLSNSASMVNTIGATRGFHADFGSGPFDGIPFITVSGSQTLYPVTSVYPDESDPGPYAIPLDAPIEGGSDSTGDRHAIAVNTGHCILYELYNAFPGTSGWTADSGAIFDLKSNALRPSTWTSADAAGLPIMPGLVTYDEVQSGEIRHAIRFTVPQTRREFVWPARHYASSLTGSQYPRMGERFRLKASFDISSFPSEVQVILRAMKRYGIILADNGSAWFITGKPDPRWDSTDLQRFSQVLGSNFEAVDATVLEIDPDSGAAIQSGVTVAVSPSSAAVRLGHFLPMTATVTGASGGVTWSVNDLPGGDPVVGAIDSNGQYLAPNVMPPSATVTIRATSVASPASSGTAAVTIIPQLSIASVSPSPVPLGGFVLTIDGAGFVMGSVVSFDGAPLPTTVVSSTRLTAAGTAPVAKSSVPVSVATPDGAISTVFVDVSAPPVVAPPVVAISISPTSATVVERQNRQFTATIQGSTNTSAVWKVNGIIGGNATVGTISQAGLYLAPGSVPSPSTVTVSATAAADQTKTATASVAVSKAAGKAPKKSGPHSEKSLRQS